MLCSQIIKSQASVFFLDVDSLSTMLTVLWLLNWSFGCPSKIHASCLGFGLQHVLQDMVILRGVLVPQVDVCPSNQNTLSSPATPLSSLLCRWKLNLLEILVTWHTAAECRETQNWMIINSGALKTSCCKRLRCKIGYFKMLFACRQVNLQEWNRVTVQTKG